MLDVLLFRHEPCLFTIHHSVSSVGIDYLVFGIIDSLMNFQNPVSGFQNFKFRFHRQGFFIREYLMWSSFSDFGFWGYDSGGLNFEFRFQGLGFVFSCLSVVVRISVSAGLNFRCEVHDFGFRVRVSGFGFRVQDFRCRVPDPRVLDVLLC